MLELLTQSAWAERIGWVLVHSLWQFALVALLAVGLKWTLARRSSAIRYWALLSAMLVMVAAPVATWFSLWSSDAPAPAVEYRAVEMPDNILTTQHVSPLELREDATAARAARPERSDGRGESPGDPATPFAEPQGRATQGSASGFVLSFSPVEKQIRPWLPQIVLVWFAGVLLAAFRPLLSWHTVRRLRRVGVSPVAGAVRCVLDRTAKRLRVARAVELLQSALVKTPVVVGYFRPAILLPLCVVTGLPETQLELILAHELAHIRRHDYLINLLQTLVETLFFYHPVVWWLSRQIRNERENCCDDVAMATVGNRADYGRALLAIEELRAQSTALSLAARGGSLLARIRRIAGCEPAPRVAGGGSILCVILASIVILAVVTGAPAPAAKKPEPTPAATENRTERRTAETMVVGQVVDSEGKPIAGAQVAVMAHSRGPWRFIELASQSTLLGATNADADGRFRLNVSRISSSAHSSAVVVAAADGFNFGGQEIGLDIEQPNVAISLTREQTIRGQVVDTNNDPVANAEIRVTYLDFDSPASWIQCDDASSQPPFWPKPVTTDRQGRFSLRGVDRNRTVTVEIRDERFANARYWIAPVDKVSKADNVRNQVRVSSSGEVTLSPSPLRICEGEITYGDTHQPIANARVEIGATHGMTDAAGRFRLNLPLDKTFHIVVHPPDGEPYLLAERRTDLADGEQPPKVAIALPRGVLLQGKVVDKDSGRPIAGAAIQYNEYAWPHYAPERTISNHIPSPARVATKADGTFAIAAPPGFGLLLVRGPDGDFIRQAVAPADFQITAGAILNRHYVSAFVPLDLKTDQEPPALDIAIRRGVTIRGRIVGPDNRPVDEVRMASRHFLGFNNSRDIPIRVKGGQFELHGLDPDVAVPFYFLDAKNELGATVEISGKSADAAPLVVHLQPCGKAVARFVDPEGKPHAKQSPAATFVLSPERIGAAGKHAPEVWADAEFMNYVDLEHYGRNQLTDDDGRFTFVALIPVATYKVALFNKTSSWDAKDFSVKSGETLQLPDIVIPDPAPKPTPNAAAEAKSEVIRAVEPVQKPQLRKEVDRKDIEPSGPRTIAKPENKTGKAGVALPGKAAVQGGGGFHLVRGNTTWIGSEGPPLVYDDYDKHFYISRGVHTVVLPKHTEGFGDFYGQRTLDPGVGRLDSGRVHPASGQSANIVIPRAIDLPAYQLLLQPSAQEALHLSDDQRNKLQDISAKYWPARRKIAGKELDDLEAAAQKELTVYAEKAGWTGAVRSLPVGTPFSKEVVEELERQWTAARSQIEKVLTAEQLRMLKDLTFRTFAFGSGAMFEPEVLARLGVDKTQHDKLRALEVELQKEKDRRLRGVTREKVKKMMAVLTPQQLSQLREKHSPNKDPETDCSMYPYPALPSSMPDTGAAEELGFSAEQRERVREIVTAHSTTRIALDQEKQKLPLGDEKGRKAIDEKRRQEMANLRTKIEAALSPKQWASCKEMAFENQAIHWLRTIAGMAQVPGQMGLTDRLRMGVGMALILGGMGLTGEQMAALRKIDAECSDKPEQIYRELTDKALAAFTPAQQEKLRAEVDRRGW